MSWERLADYLMGSARSSARSRSKSGLGITACTRSIRSAAAYLLQSNTNRGSGRNSRGPKALI
jgi:hypothetical protein